MAILTFTYGEMSSGKTAALLEELGSYNREDAIVIKPAVDTKNGNKLLSRNGKMCDVDFLATKEDDLFEVVRSFEDKKVLFVDEAQFLTKNQANQLLAIATTLNIDVKAYGLRLNFYLGDENFYGATRLLQISHRLVCLESKCDFCKTEQAIFSCLFVDGKLQLVGPSIWISDGTKEVDAHAICSKCYLERKNAKNF